MIGLKFKNTFAFMRSFKEDTRGSMTVFGLFFFLFSGILGAIALDITSLYAERTHLQVAADQAAHAALYNRVIVGLDDDDAKDLAIAIVKITLPVAKYGVTMDADDIEFGEYDFDTKLFTPDPDGVGAVRVTTAFTDGRGNSASAYLFRLIGFDNFEIYTSSTFAAEDTFRCLSDGFVAEGPVIMRNQNFFNDGICIHSNDYVGLGPNNGFAPGVTVSMPMGIRGLDLSFTNGINPPSEDDPDYVAKYEEYMALLRAATDRVVAEDEFGNETEAGGLTNALQEATLPLNVFSRVDNMINLYLGQDFDIENIDGDHADLPSYLNVVVDLGPDATGADTMEAIRDAIRTKLATPDEIALLIDRGNNGRGRIINGSDLSPNKIYVVDECDPDGNANSNTMNIENSTDVNGNIIPIEKVVIVTSCNVTFAQGTIVNDARIITTATGDKSFSAPSGLQIGSFDGECQIDEAGAQLVTKGSMHVASGFKSYGSQVIASENIFFAANPSAERDFVGMSMTAGGSIDMQSHVNAKIGCGDADGSNNIRPTYITMVR
jgi:hypothetical protein